MASNAVESFSDESRQTVEDLEECIGSMDLMGGTDESESSSSSVPQNLSLGENSSKKRKRLRDEAEIDETLDSYISDQDGLPIKKTRNNFESVSFLSVSSSSPCETTKNSDDVSTIMRKQTATHSMMHPNDAEKKTKSLTDRNLKSNDVVHVDLNSNHRYFHNNSKQFLYHSSLDDDNEKNEKNSTSQFLTKKVNLSFGIDRILSSPELRKNKIKENNEDGIISSLELPVGSPEEIRKLKCTGDNRDNSQESIYPFTSLHPHHLSYPHSHNHSPTNPLNLSRCSECYFLGRYCRNNENLQYPNLFVNSTTGGQGGGIPASFASWMSSSIYENSPLLSPTAYHPHASLPATYGMNASTFSTMSSLVACNPGSGGRRKRSWSRAVFSSLQRKGLEKRFQIQKYITKPDRRQLAATLGLTDAQVKVWFQNRRMKWRHSKEGKVTSGVGDISCNSTSSIVGSTAMPDKSL